MNTTNQTFLQSVYVLQNSYICDDEAYFINDKIFWDNMALLESNE